ncbi:hypothetical protein PLICRDRAFT_693447 [Plicaturopsis crispa FD-325 SS-3]|nr:hypothetical protein PLICRDRAFT_693447 [Plicaturopsis crispa FD-325 SS-3]
MNPMSVVSGDRRLPLELEHEIIGHLASPDPDLTSLRHCALVHTSLRPQAQSLLFRTVHLHPAYNAAFVQLLDDNPHIGPYVNILTVREGSEMSDDEPNFANETLPLIAPALINLHTLGIAEAEMNLSPSTRATLNTSFGHSLRTLMLEEFLVETPLAFIQFILGFPLLENLELCGRGWLGTNNKEPITLPIPPSFRLKRLSIRWVDLCEKLLAWFADMDTHPQLSIRSFEVLEISHKNAIAVGQFLRKIGPGLEKYTIGMEIHEHSDVVTIVKQASISSNTSLRKLVLGGLVIFDSRDVKIRSRWVPLLLEDVSSPTLSEVEFRVWYRSAADLHVLQLPLVENILTSSRFPALERVVFTLNGWDDADETKTEIHTLMPVLAEKGMIIFQ